MRISVCWKDEKHETENHRAVTTLISWLMWRPFNTTVATLISWLIPRPFNTRVATLISWLILRPFNTRDLRSRGLYYTNERLPVRLTLVHAAWGEIGKKELLKIGERKRERKKKRLYSDFIILQSLIVASISVPQGSQLQQLAFTHLYLM